jgi:hypothetical protein
MEQKGHVAHMGNKINTRKVLVAKCNPKRPLGIRGAECGKFAVNLINRVGVWAGIF